MRMRSRINFIRQIKPTHLAIGAGIILAALNLSLLLVGLRLESEAQGLQEVGAELAHNLSQLQASEEEGLRALEAELAAAQNRLEELETSFPEIGAGFSLYRRGFELAGEHGVQVGGIQRLGSTVQSTVVGSLHLTSYAIQSQAELGSCLAFISALEDEGLGTLAMQSMQIRPEVERCNFDLDISSVHQGEPTQ